MAVICPQCNTKNRSVAKFCIECIEALPTTFADEQSARSTAASSLFAFTRRGAATAEPANAVAAPHSKGLWVSIAGLSIALIIGAAGWLVAGAGGWYFYSAGKAQVHPIRPDTSTDAQVPALQPVASPPVPDASEREVELPSDLSGATPSVDGANRKTASSPRAAPPSSQPGEACKGLNFVAAARCMTTQCLRIEFKAHPQCQAVRRQQRLEEEKRNPTAP